MILEEKARGGLPLRKKLPADWLVSLTARTMEERERRRRIYRELFRNFRETAVGMMENIQDAEESVESFFDKVAENIHREFDSRRKG